MKSLQQLADSEQPSPTFVRLPTVRRMTGLGRSTIYRLVAIKEFPSPVRIAARAVAWRQTDLDTWADARRSVREPDSPRTN